MHPGNGFADVQVAKGAEGTGLLHPRNSNDNLSRIDASSRYGLCYSRRADIMPVLEQFFAAVAIFVRPNPSAVVANPVRDNATQWLTTPPRRPDQHHGHMHDSGWL